MDGKVLGAAEVRQLATLESREVLLARLAGLLQASAQQAVTLLAAPLRQVATMTAALRDKTRGSPSPARRAAARAPTEGRGHRGPRRRGSRRRTGRRGGRGPPQGETTDTSDTNDTNEAAAETAGAES